MRRLVVAGLIAGAQASGVTLLAIGDWGGQNNLHPTTKGQVMTASGMSSAAGRLAAQGVLLLGDNFYEDGVQSCKSKRFEETFEDVYPADSFKGLPFYVVAGNHDHHGNVTAQVEYKDAEGRWHFPSLYYSLPFSFNSSSGKHRTVQLLMVDTVVLAGLSDDECNGCDLPGPLDMSSAEAEWGWLEDQLKSSTADFLWVAGHYPIYSAGKDGTTKLLVQKLLPMLNKYGAHYISGHDHMVEHIEHDGVQMFVAGMGRECCYADSKFSTVPEGAIRYMLSGEGGRGSGAGPRPASDVFGGFASMSFDDEAIVAFYDQAGNELYSAPPVPPRTASELVV